METDVVGAGGSFLLETKSTTLLRPVFPYCASMYCYRPKMILSGWASSIA